MKSAEKVRQPAPIPAVRPCDNPECRSPLEWSGGRGRPAFYCSDICRKRTVSVAAKLVRAIRAQERDIEAGGLTYRAERTARTELARLEWLLSSYPAGVATPRT